MSEQANLLKVPVDFEFDGKTYSVGPVDFEIEALFTRHLESGARDYVNRHRDTMDLVEYQGHLDGLRRDAAAHAYDWDGMLAAKARATVAGVKQLAFFRLRKYTEKKIPVTLKMVDAVFADDKAWERLMAAMDATNPKRPTPESQEGDPG